MPAGYDYVAVRPLRINGILAFTTGMLVPDDTADRQGWIDSGDVIAADSPNFGYDILQFLLDTSEVWAADDPVLTARVAGMEVDTGKFKIGDGTTAWSSLPYAVSSGGSSASIVDNGTYVTMTVIT